MARLWRGQGKRVEAYDLLAARSSAGSPKVSTRSTYRRRRRCSTSCAPANV